MCPPALQWLLGKTSGTGFNTGRKAAVSSGEVLPLRARPAHEWVGHEWSHKYKGFEPLFSREKKKRKKEIGSNYMPFWKRQNYGDNKKISGCQAFGGEG